MLTKKNNQDEDSLPKAPYNARVKFIIEMIAGGKKIVFGRIVGKHSSTITQVTQGKYRLTHESTERLLKIGINLNWLESGEGEPFTDFSEFQTPIKRIEYFIEYGRHILRFEQDKEFKKNASVLSLQLKDRRLNRLSIDFNLKHFSDEGKFLYDLLLEKYGMTINNSWIIDGSGTPFKGVKSLQSGLPSAGKGEVSSGKFDVTCSRDAQYNQEQFYYIPELEYDLIQEAQRLINATKEIFNMAFRKEWVLRKTRNPDKLRLFLMPDDSMQPILYENDIILVDTSLQQPMNGKILLIKADSQYMVKRIITYPNNKIIAKSDNKLYPEWNLSKSNDTEIIGRVIWYGRDM